MGEKKIGVLLVNLGTPKSFRPKDVFHYLNEFLTDGRVIDLPWLQRQCLVRGIIVPFRYKDSAKLYQRLWTEEGSPLLIHGLSVRDKLQSVLGEHFYVSLAMRYQTPSIKEGLEQLRQKQVDEILVFPLFPQYASATTGSVHQKVMDEIKHWQVIPKLTFVSSYADHPALIHAFCERARQYSLQSYDHVLFSFHGLPEKQIRKADEAGACLTSGCCDKQCKNNTFCYKAQCYATARAIASQLAMQPSSYTICFQSRLGKDPWIQPYTTEVLQACSAKGYKRLLVFCPSFVCDCLETTCEVSYEYAHTFKSMGGETVQLVEGLNSHPDWIEALKIMVREHTHSKSA
ncbi:ferrochelatase [Candidatus Protochlamydia phocaeensis]|uniref:ferrochelatase n=1 Tax=Candidatus Protochlamydia phocaeensis TaxID=1414722 RepID=UPI0008394D48|nr:ferrochelatase [Candidatus Protochlamydia phocaeensis]